MIECHALVLLSREHDHDPWRELLGSINGLVAPGFIFGAGFALALVFGRAGREPGGLRRRTPKTLLRIGEVALVAVVLKFRFNPVLEDPSWWFRPDILSCIVVSLLAVTALNLVCAAQSMLVAILSGALAVTVFGISGNTEHMRPGGILGHLLNGATGSMFPLVPWTGYAFLGSMVGAIASRPNAFAAVRRTVLFTAVAAMMVVLSSRRLENVLIDPGFLINHAERIAKTMGIALVMLSIEAIATSHGFALWNPVTRVLEHFGRSSLSAYAIHLLVLYGVGFGIELLNVRGAKCDWPEYVMWTIVVITVTGVLCHLLDLLRAKIADLRAG